jgi:metacaspase-1
MTGRGRLFAGAALAIALTGPALADRAVVVGIDSYPGLDLPRSLTGAAADARRFGEALVTRAGFAEDEVTLLTNDAATAEAIMRAVIDNLISGTGPGERAVFYFSGLGTYHPFGGGGAREVLLARDAPEVLGSVPGDALAEILDLLDGRDVTVVIDASFHTDSSVLPGTIAAGRSLRLGGLGGGLSPDSAPLRPAFGTGTASRAVWTASAPDQVAWETAGRGVFTEAFLDGLAGAADRNGNGTMTNAELLTFVRTRLAAWCDSSADCTAESGALTPVFEGPLQDPVLGAARIEPEETATIHAPRPLPVSTDTGAPPGLAETLGFVTDLFTPSNAARLRLDISMDGPLRLGDRVRFSATSERAGTLVLLDVNPRGELAQIFPSRLAPGAMTRIAAGETLMVPNGIGAGGAPVEVRVTEPAGKGFLLALLIEGDLPDLTAVLPENLDGGPVPNAGRYLYEIAQDLLRLQASGSGSTAVDWSATYLPYEILP